SPTDLASLDKWDQYTQAKDAMFFYTDAKDAPWTVVKSNDKHRARLQSMRHVLNLLPYPGKDTSVVYDPDPLICGPASVLSESGEGSGGSFPLVRQHADRSRRDISRCGSAGHIESITMSKLFGTDGVRGVANEKLTVELATKLSQAAAVVLGHEDAGDHRPKAVVARDPRISSEFINAAVAAGLASSGVDVYDAGVLPTPAAAFLVDDIQADCGVMISASHNPAADNGIKFLARGGEKLTDAQEDRILAQMDRAPRRPIGGQVGRVRRFSDAEDRDVIHLLKSMPNRLDGLKVVIDAAHG